MEQDIRYETDVLVVGGGGAGFRAAIEASFSGAKTILVNKGKLTRSGATVMADADITVDGKSLNELGFFGEPKDSKEKFFRDILAQGFYLNNQKLLQLYVDNAPDRLKELLEWGLIVESSEERAIETPGHSILDSLYKIAKQNGVEMLENVMIIDFLTKENRVLGAIGLDIITGKFIIIKAKSVVIASGGWHKAYDPNAGSRELSGDGIAMALRAGATLGNMEFVTFCANIVYWPNHLRGSLFTYILHIILGGPLYNSQGKNIFDGYDPYVVRIASSSEWNKCIISNISFKEILEGNISPHGGIYLKVEKEKWNTLKKEIEEYFPGWKYRGGDFSELRDILSEGKGIEIGPGAEYFEGGIFTDENYKSTLEGLFAAGESAMSLFGANRVVAATTEMLVTGAIAGKSAAEYSKHVELMNPSEEQVERLKGNILELLENKGKFSPLSILNEIREKSFKLLGPIRDKNGLETLLQYIYDVKNNKMKNMYLTTQRRKYNLDWINAIELKNIVDILEVATLAALERTESRGVHYRSDYPFTDNDQWLKEILIVPDDDKYKIQYNPITVTKIKQFDGKYPYMEMVKKLMLSRSDITGGH